MHGVWPHLNDAGCFLRNRKGFSGVEQWCVPSSVSEEKQGRRCFTVAAAISLPVSLARASDVYLLAVSFAGFVASHDGLLQWWPTACSAQDCQPDDIAPAKCLGWGRGGMSHVTLR